MHVKLSKLSREYAQPLNELKSYYQECVKEIQNIDNLPVTKTEIEGILKATKPNFQLSDYIPEKLAFPIGKILKIIGGNELSALTILLPIAASLVNPDTNLMLIENSKFLAKPIFFSSIIGESGSSKSSILNLFSKPLIALQALADKQYNRALKEFESFKGKDEDAPKQPVPTEYYLQDFTSEAIAKVQFEQPEKGFLLLFDELSMLINNNNSYRGGKGSDAEKSCQQGTVRLLRSIARVAIATLIQEVRLVSREALNPTS